MEVEKNVDDVLKNALVIVRKEETLVRYILNNLYFLLTFILYYVNFNFHSINTVYIKSGDTSRLLKESSILHIFDNGIRIFNFFFPYETVIRFGSRGERVVLTVYANVICREKSITFLKLGELSEVILSFKIKNPENILNSIKNNMYYHFKYNKINKSIIKKLM